MSETAAQRHNRLAPELVSRIVKETKGEGEALILLESVVLGVMLYTRPAHPTAVSEFLDSLTLAVVNRMKPR